MIVVASAQSHSRYLLPVRTAIRRAGSFGEAGDLDICRQGILQRDGCSDLSGANNVASYLVDALMDRFEEVLRFEEVGDTMEAIVVDKDGAEQRLFGFEVMRG
jgi:hypothetical protein